MPGKLNNEEAKHTQYLGVPCAVRTIETQHRWEKPGITNPGFEVDPTASILEEKLNMKGKYKAGV